MATAIASTTACVRYRWTRKCLPLNVAIVVNSVRGLDRSPENGGQRNRPPPRPSTRSGNTRARSNASSPSAGDLSSSVAVARFLTRDRTKVRTANAERRRFAINPGPSLMGGTTLDCTPSLLGADRGEIGARGLRARRSSALKQSWIRRCIEMRSRSRCPRAGRCAEGGSARQPRA